jgi:hypothetical protein
MDTNKEQLQKVAQTTTNESLKQIAIKKLEQKKNTKEVLK